MNFKYNNALAVCYGHIDEVESALEVFERCGQIGTEDGEFWYNYSLTLLKGIPYSIWDGERIERAKECFGKAIEYEQEELICYLALAGILQHQGFQEESKAHLAKAEELGANLNLAFQKKGGTFQAPQYGATTPIALPDEWK